MTVEEKNILVEQYIKDIAIKINKQIPGFITEENIKVTINTFKDRPEDFEKIKKQIDALLQQKIDIYNREKSTQEQRHYVLNEFFDCRLSNGTLHLHVIPKDIKQQIIELGMRDYYEYIDKMLSDALTKIPEILSDPNNSDIRNIFAVSPLLRTSTSQEIFRKYGFETSTEVDEKFIIMFNSERLGQASISKNKFLNLYQKQNADEDKMDVEIKNEHQDSVENSYVRKIDRLFLESIGFTEEQILEIEKQINITINKKLYTNTKDFHHDIKHIERVMIYVQWILNEKEKNGEIVENQSILKTAALYHDIGKSINASNKTHGIVGSFEFRKKYQGILNDDYINRVCALIETHAVDDDEIHLTNITEAELRNLQVLSDILKDADALDRNRLNHPAPFGVCDINRLRTPEAKKIFSRSNELLREYQLAYIKEKEKKLNTKIFDNYEKFRLWMQEERRGIENIYHASLEPTIETLIPSESTQEGVYLYGDTDPIKCTKMASFRYSFLFKRDKDPHTGESIILDVFSGTAEETLKDKFITIYKLPKEYFKKYETSVTSAKNGEYISKVAVTPEDQITFPALEYFKFLSDNHRFKLVENKKEEKKLESVLESFRLYIWDIKKQANNPYVFDERFARMKNLINYYCPQYLDVLKTTRSEVDKLIAEERLRYIAENKEIKITDEDESFLKSIETKYFKNYVNKDYINKMLHSDVKDNDKTEEKALTNGLQTSNETSLEESKLNEERVDLLIQKRQLEAKKEENIEQSETKYSDGPKRVLTNNGYISSIISITITILAGILFGLILKG